MNAVTGLDTFGKRIRILRQDLDLTQAELRRQLELAGVVINQSYISTMERSNKTPSGEVLRGLAKALQTTTDYLLLLTDDPLLPGEVDDDARVVTDEEWALLGALRALPDGDRLILMEMLRGMIDVAQRQRQRTGRPLIAIEGAPVQLPRVPSSRADFASTILSLTEAELEALAVIAADILRNR